MKAIEQLFKQSLGFKFDTPKKLNRSRKRIPEQVIEDLENGMFTCEAIDALQNRFPIFRYQTCITIHGQWQEIERTRVGGYKNVHQNQNGSVEIRYSAIDCDKIERVRREISGVSPFRFSENSSERYFYIHKQITKETFPTVREELQPIAERLTKSNIYGHVNLFLGQTMMGTFLCLHVHALAIPEKEVHPFSLQLCGLNQTEWELKKAAFNKTLEEEEAERKMKQTEWEKERELQKKELLAKLETLKPQISHLQECNDLTKGTLVKIVQDRELHFVYYKLDGKGSFGRVSWSKAKSETFISDVQQLQWISQKQRLMDEFRIQNFRLVG